MKTKKKEKKSKKLFRFAQSTTGSRITKKVVEFVSLLFWRGGSFDLFRLVFRQWAVVLWSIRLQRDSSLQQLFIFNIQN